MAKTNDEIKKEFQTKIAALKAEKLAVIKKYKEKIRERKIEKIKKEILDL